MYVCIFIHLCIYICLCMYIYLFIFFTNTLLSPPTPSSPPPCSEMPNYDVLIPVLLKEGIDQLPNHCKLTPGEQPMGSRGSEQELV